MMNFTNKKAMLATTLFSCLLLVSESSAMERAKSTFVIEKTVKEVGNLDNKINKLQMQLEDTTQRPWKLKQIQLEINALKMEKERLEGLEFSNSSESGSQEDEIIKMPQEGNVEGGMSDEESIGGIPITTLTQKGAAKALKALNETENVQVEGLAPIKEQTPKNLTGSQQVVLGAVNKQKRERMQLPLQESWAKKIPLNAEIKLGVLNTLEMTANVMFKKLRDHTNSLIGKLALFRGDFPEKPEGFTGKYMTKEEMESQIQDLVKSVDTYWKGNHVGATQFDGFQDEINVSKELLKQEKIGEPEFYKRIERIYAEMLETYEVGKILIVSNFNNLERALQTQMGEIYNFTHPKVTKVKK